MKKKIRYFLSLIILVNLLLLYKLLYPKGKTIKELQQMFITYCDDFLIT